MGEMNISLPLRWNQVSQMVALLPCFTPLQPGLREGRFCHIAPSRCTQLHTHGCMPPPPAVVFAHYTRVTSNLPHPATFVSSNMSRDDGDIFPLTTRLEHRVQRPGAGANVNEALSRRRHRLAEGRRPSLTQDRGVSGSSIISSDVIITSVTSPADHVNNDAIIITGLLRSRWVWTVQRAFKQG